MEDIEAECNDEPDQADDSRDIAYLFKLNSCASSPCLTDFLRSSIKQGTSHTVYDPMSKIGTASQLYLQIMSPRAFTQTPVLTGRTRNLSRSDSETSSDSGVVFRLGNDEDSSEDSDHLSCSPLSRNHTMPDLSIITCN